jgi:hypothetical protein
MKKFRQLSEEITASSKPEAGREAVGGRFTSSSPKKPTKPAPHVTAEETISEIIMPQVKDDLGGMDRMSFVKKHGVSKTVAKQKLATEAKEKTEYDYEGDMARGQLQSIISNAQRVHDMLEDDTNIAEWVQSKITLAEDYISTVANYMMSEIDEAKDVGDIPSGDVNSPNLSVKKGKTVASGPIQELSSDLLGRYKKKAGEQASAADKAGDYDKGNKRFSGIMKATKKQFANDMKKEEVVQEGRPSQRHPLEGHEYHKKTDAELVHIAKDAHAAAEAMKSHNTTAENKYRDQANDSATVRHFRKTSGTPDWYKKKYGHMKEEVVTEMDKSQTPPGRDSGNDEASKKEYAAKIITPKKVVKNGENLLNKIFKSKEKIKESFRPMDEPNYNNSIQARQKKADDSNKPPFDGPYKKNTGVVTDKSGAKHGGMSIARNLARQALKKQSSKMSVREGLEESRKAEIVKEIMKKGKKKEDNSFQGEPELGSTVVKADN